MKGIQTLFRVFLCASVASLFIVRVIDGHDSGQRRSKKTPVG
jgi:hypothetical protein